MWAVENNIFIIFGLKSKRAHKWKSVRERQLGYADGILLTTSIFIFAKNRIVVSQR